MEQPAINQHLVRRYLLGELPDSDRERLEVGLLTDDRFYETLTALEEEVEDELIDQYLDGELTQPERENFERVFLTTSARAHKLQVIKELKVRAAVPEMPESYVSPIPQPHVIPPSFWQDRVVAIFQNPFVGLSTATALTLVLLACVWLIMRSNRLDAELRQAQAQHPTDAVLKERLEQLNRRNEDLRTELQRSQEQRSGLEQELMALKTKDSEDNPKDKASPSRLRYATVFLSPSLRSTSSGEATLTLRPNDTVARLVLDVERVNPKDYKRFRAVVRRSVGAEIWRSEDVKLQPRGSNARAVLTVPVEKLVAGQYVGELDGITSEEQAEPVGLYAFRVVPK